MGDEINASTNILFFSLYINLVTAAIMFIVEFANIIEKHVVMNSATTKQIRFAILNEATARGVVEFGISHAHIFRF